MMKYYSTVFSLYLGVGLIVMLFLGSCTSAKTVNYLQDISPTYTSKPFVDYKLQYKDEIYCTILTSNTDFSSTFNSDVFSSIITTTGSTGGTPYTIYENGNISIPFFGDINVVGKTIPEAEEVIQARMRQAIPDAQVKVTLRNNIYYVVSDERTGQFEIYKDNMTIYQALAYNGSPSSRIDISKVKIVRTNESGNSVVKTFDLRAESVIESEFYYVNPNDVIYYSTGKSAFFRIDSFTSLISTIAMPISTVLAVFAIIGKYK